MNSQEFVTPYNELPQFFRPRHQLVWPLWDTRDKLEPPWQIGFPKGFANRQWFCLAQNGDTKLLPGEGVESVITAISEDTITEAVGKLETVVPITVGTTTVAENLFQDGFLQIKDHAGKGYNFQIKENEAGGGSAGDTIKIFLAHHLPIELDLTSDVQIVTSPFRNLRKSRGAGNKFMGIPPTEVDPNNYFWLQFEGPALAIAGETIVANRGTVWLAPDSQTEATNRGRVVAHPATAGVDVIGYRLDPNAVLDGGVFSIFLKCQ